MPITERRPLNGIYLDPCHPAPVFRVRWIVIVAMLVSLLLWLVLIFAAVAIYRYMRGGA